MASRKKQFDDVVVFMEYGIDLLTKTIYIGSDEVNEGSESGVDVKLAEKVIKGLHILDSQPVDENKPINVILQGYGGDTYYALSIFDAIKGCKNKVSITAYGPVMSSHSIIFQAGNIRKMSKNSRMMIHAGSFSVDDHPKIFRKWAEESKKLDKDIEDIYFEQIVKKLPDFKVSELKRMLDFDTILNSQQCVEVGLCDQII